jgi:hypothetical protein
MQYAHGINDRQDLVPFIVAHGTDAKVSAGPKGECNMSMGQMTDRTMGYLLWSMEQRQKYKKVQRVIATCPWDK